MKTLRQQINQTLKNNGLSTGKTKKFYNERKDGGSNQFGSYTVQFQQVSDGYRIQKNKEGFYVHPISDDWKKRLEILDFIFETLKDEFNVVKSDEFVRVIS